jgi:mono/diheme cytochrome c family protein
MTRNALMLAAGLTFAAMLGASDALAASVSHGRQIAERNCAQCHAIGPKGESRNKVAPPFRTLGKRYPIDMLAEALAEGMLTGHPEMPEFRFSPSEIDDLIAYLKSVQTQAQAKASKPVEMAYRGGRSSR